MSCTIIIDWFADNLKHNGFKIRPKRFSRLDDINKAFESLVDGEVLVNVLERRIFQKLDGKIVEWGIISDQYKPLEDSRSRIQKIIEQDIDPKFPIGNLLEGKNYASSINKS